MIINISILSKVKLAPLVQLKNEFLTNIQLDSVHTFCFMSPGNLWLKMSKVGIISTSSEVQTPQFEQLIFTAASRNLVNKNQQNLAKYSVEVEIYFKKYFK